MQRMQARRVGRPKSKEKREAICAAASGLFLAQGLQQTSMDAVAAEAGVSKQTVYSHFKNKQDLFRSVILGKVTNYHLSEIDLPPGGDLREALVTLGHRYLQLLFDEDVIAMFRVVIGESASHPKIAQLFNETGPEKTIEAVQDFLCKQVEGGQLQIDDLRYAAVLFLSMVRGDYQMQFLMSLCPDLREEKKHQHIDKAVHQFLLLYGPRV